MNGLWYAVLTTSLLLNARLPIRSCTSCSASAEPETVTLIGELMHATTGLGTACTRSIYPCASSSPSPTASIPISLPPASRPAESLPRWYAMVHAAAREMDPLAYAAAISPLLCPTTASGATPQPASRSTRATWTAVHAGWLTCGSLTRGPAISSARSHPHPRDRRCAAASAMRDLKTA